MEKPTSPVALPPSSPPSNASTNSNSNSNQQQQQRRKQPPTAEELVSHYVSQGMDSKEAPLKVIEDLQTILLKVVASGRGGKKDRFMADTSRKLDNVNTRLAILEMKLDSKPAFPETFALGVAAGTAVTGIGSVLPHVLGAFGQMWDAVRSSTTASLRRS